MTTTVIPASCFAAGIQKKIIVDSGSNIVITPEGQEKRIFIISSLMSQKLLSTIFLYVIWLIIVIFRVILGSFEEVGLWIVLAFNILVIKDVLLYMVDIKANKKISYDRKKIKKSGLYYYLILNRVYVFPVLLTIYLIFLLIKQTHVFNLQNNIFYLILNENILLAGVIITGILTVFKDEKDKQYQITKDSLSSTYVHLGLSILLSLLGTFIILGQTITLGWIAYLISGIAGILIFLIGILIIEEDETH